MYHDSSNGGLQPIQGKSYGFVVDTRPDTIPACILDDFLYLGSQDAVNFENISKYKITYVLSIGVPAPPIDGIIQHELCVKYVECFDLPEYNIIEKILPLACECIDAQKGVGRVLVHCNAGVSRSASIVIAYLMTKCGYSFQDAFDLVKCKRECIQPNIGFIRQLKTLKN